MRILLLTFTITFSLHAFEKIIVEAYQPQAIPSNTTKIEKKEIDFTKHQHINELINQEPAVMIHRMSGIEHLTSIRSPVFTGGAGAGSFLFMEDGIPLRAPGFGNINGLLEAHSESANSVEILRGPGDAAIPSNAQHGALNFKMNIPENSSLLLSTSSYGVYKFGSNININNKYGIHFDIFQDGSFQEGSILRQQKASFIAKISKDLRFQLFAQNFKQNGGGYIEGFEAYENETDSRANQNPDAFRKGKTIRSSLRWEKRWSPTISTKVTPYLRYNEMDFIMHFLPSMALEESGHKSVGLLSSIDITPSRKSRITSGLDFDYTTGSLKEEQELPTVSVFEQGTHYDYKVHAFMLAPYLLYKTTYTSKLISTIGVRWEHSYFDYENLTSAGILGKHKRISDRTDNFDTLRFNADLEYTLSDFELAYIFLRKGERAPQTTDLYRLESNQEVTGVKPESLISVETGFKTKRQNTQFHIAFYYMEKNNFFFRDVDGFNVVNGKSKHLGIEIDYKGNAGLIYWGVGFTYASHYYDFTNSVSSISNSTEAIQKGNTIDTAPSQLGNIRVGLNLKDKLRCELQLSHTGKYFLDPSNIHQYKGHDIFNFRVQYQKKNFELFLHLLNILDTRYAERADYFRSTYRYLAGKGRTIGTGIKYTF